MNSGGEKHLRRCAVTENDRPTPAKLRQAILRNENTQTDFSVITVPHPPRDQTAFAVQGNDKVLLIGIALFDAEPKRIAYEKSPNTDVTEIYFDLRHDRLGWFRFEFTPEGDANTSYFLPYPEAHSSSYPLLRLKKHTTELEYFPSGASYAMRCRWIWAWFDAREVFHYGHTVGFNVCRFRPDYASEFSAWSFPSGNGGPDATSFGDLLRDTSTLLAATTEGRKSAPVKKHPFTVSMTYDFPDCLMAQPYTPASLHAEMKVIKDWGIQRLHWIDNSDAPSFWAMHYWDRNYRNTAKACGDILRCAVQQAHANGLEIITDFKVFDLAINTFYLDDHPCTVQQSDGLRSTAIPEIVAHPEWTQQSNPAWRSTPVTNIARLRIYSKTPLPEIDASSVSLLVSNDNRRYTKYRGSLKIHQAKLRRTHLRWTPAGNERDKGAETNWVIEFSGLNIKEPFASIEIAGDDIWATHHGHMFAEAFDANGKCAPLTMATTSRSEVKPDGHYAYRDGSYYFWKDWPGWNNHTEPIVHERKWRLNDLGMTFQIEPNNPSLLEPSYEGTRNIWLKRIEKMLDAGVDGVCIRIFNHHNGIKSWLEYAFAPVIVETFQKKFGRNPGTSPEDYERVRRIRGEYFTQFLRDAKKLTSARGKKLMVQLESGIEIPPHLDTRMQLHLDYQRWIQERIVDEVLMKDWTSHSPWVRENVLPLAQKQNVPAHIISRCLNNGLDPWAMETTPRLLTNAYQNGFSGFNFYEVCNLVELNPEGVPLPKGYSTPAITKAVRELRRLQEAR